MSYISVDGKTYKDFQEYCNSDDLELDDKFRKLLSGNRTPQTEEERAWLENMGVPRTFCTKVPISTENQV